MMTPEAPRYKVRLLFARYLASALKFLGLLILLALILDHFLHYGTTLSHTEKYLFLGFSVTASLALLTGFALGTARGRQWIARSLRISESETVSPPKTLQVRLLAGAESLLIFAIVFAAYLDSRSAVIQLDASRTFNDTRGYINSTNYSLSDIRFWAGARPFTCPSSTKYAGILPLTLINKTQWNGSAGANNLFQSFPC